MENINNSSKFGVRVSYNTGFSKKGSAFSQRLTIHLTKEQIKSFKVYVLEKVLEKDTDTHTSLFLKSVAAGENYANITTFKHFVEFFKLEGNKRIKYDRNTIIKIYVVD